MFNDDLKAYEHWRLIIFREKFALKKPDNQVISLMTRQGVHLPKALAFLSQAKEEYTAAEKSGKFKRVIRKKFILHGIVAIVFVALPWFLNYHTLNGLNPGLAVVLAAAITFCIIQMIADYRKPTGYKPDNDPFCIEPHRYSARLLILWVPLFFGLMSVENIKHTQAIQQEVVLTTGIIVAGEANEFVGRFTKNNHYSVLVNLDDGKQKKIELGRQENHSLFNAYIGQEVLIAWHDEEPTLRKLLMPADTQQHHGRRTTSFRNYINHLEENRAIDQKYIRSNPDRIDTINTHH
jgi:hypothetical protein